MACRRAVLPNSPGFKSRRINTCKRISKQTTSTPPESHSYKNMGGGGTSSKFRSVLFPRGADYVVTTHLSRITNSFLFRRLRALSPCAKSYLFPFQSLAASFARTPGMGYPQKYPFYYPCFPPARFKLSYNLRQHSGLPLLRTGFQPQFVGSGFWRLNTKN